MRLVCRGKASEKHFLKALSMLELLEIPKELEIFVIDDPKYCAEIIRPLPAHQTPIFRQFCNKERTSFSYSWGGKETIIIQITKENAFISTNLKAAAGLLAHEIMHTIMRRRGLDRHLADCYIASYYKNYPLLKKLDFPQAQLEDLFTAVGREAMMALKDLYVNTEVLALGLGDYLLEYYYNRLGTLKYRPMPVFFTEKALMRKSTFQAMRDALLFQITLMPMHIPFQAYHHKDAKLLLKQIEKCYERNVKEISREFHDVNELVFSEFSPSCEFHKKYFKMVFMKTYKLLI